MKKSVILTAILFASCTHVPSLLAQYRFQHQPPTTTTLTTGKVAIPYPDGRMTHPEEERTEVVSIETPMGAPDTEISDNPESINLPDVVVPEGYHNTTKTLATRNVHALESAEPPKPKVVPVGGDNDINAWLKADNARKESATVVPENSTPTRLELTPEDMF